MKSFKPLSLSLAIAAISAMPAVADEAALQAKVEQLNAQLEALKTEIQQLHTQTDAIANQQESVAAQVVASTAASESAAGELGASLWGYGEINYNHPTKGEAGQAQMDLRRAVFGIGYKFSDKTRFVSEYEVEHAIASADDEGEVEVEQFYIDHQLGDKLHLKAGLFLIPSGLLNDSHEPTSYYGVERNLVETAIIPTTWREGGLAVYGSTDAGLAWEVGVTTTVDLNGWDASSDEGRESPLGSIHQELQLASASDLGTYAALNYRGIPGFTLGASVFTSAIAQDNPELDMAKDARMTLWDIHSRWTPGNWDLSAVYARGSISDTRELNISFAGEPTPVPEDFYGWYAQAAYKVWQNGDYSLSPFVRYERVNTAAGYASMPQGLELNAATAETLSTLGVSFYLNPNVVFKLDYQDFAEDDSSNRVQLGLGLSF